MTKVSIIIPTFNRPNYLKRILDYYNNHKIDYKIIVADSGSNKNKIINQENISLYRNLNILHLKNYLEETNPSHKITDALNCVQTEYCVICADDDFITPEGIKQSVEFLENNLDFTVVQGHQISFRIIKKKRRKILKWQAVYSCKSIIFSNSEQRLIKHLSNYSITTFYSVHRTNFLKMIYEETSKFTDDVRFGEILPSMLTLIYGKMKCLDVLYGAREVIPESGGNSLRNINDFIRERNYKEKYNKFKNCLANHLSKNSQLSIEQSKSVIDKAMDIYLKKFYPDGFKRFFIDKTKSVFVFLNLYDNLYKKIKYLYIKKRLTFSRPKDNFLKYIEDPSSKYYNDFIKIRDCVISHIKN